MQFTRRVGRVQIRPKPIIRAAAGSTVPTATYVFMFTPVNLIFLVFTLRSKY